MSSKSWVGLVLLVLGFWYLLADADILEFSEILSTWWPLVLITIGVVQLLSRSIAPFSGILFIAIGGLFLINELVDVHLAAYIWPLSLIIVGLTFIFSRAKRDTPLH